MANSVNGTISAGDFGSRPITATRVEYGIKILSLEDSARTRRVFHPKKVVPASFSITIVMPTYEQYRDFNQWMLSVVKEMVVAENTVPFRVDIPTYDFLQYGILESDIPLGEAKPGIMIRKQTLMFSTTKDPIDTTIPDEISFAVPATYFEAGGAPGDYPSAYAVAVSGDDIVDRWHEPDTVLFGDVVHQSLSAWFS